jgi:hypothetical protein
MTNSSFPENEPEILRMGGPIKTDLFISCDFPEFEIVIKEELTGPYLLQAVKEASEKYRAYIIRGDYGELCLVSDQVYGTSERAILAARGYVDATSSLRGLK